MTPADLRLGCLVLTWFSVRTRVVGSRVFSPLLSYLWESPPSILQALFVESQKWIPFPTALVRNDRLGFGTQPFGSPGMMTVWVSGLNPENPQESQEDCIGCHKPSQTAKNPKDPSPLQTQHIELEPNRKLPSQTAKYLRSQTTKQDKIELEHRKRGEACQRDSLGSVLAVEWPLRGR